MRLFKSLILLITLIPNLLHSQSNYPGQGVIGKTYNVFGEFANNKSIERYPIFDFSKLELESNQFGHSLPNSIYIENISDHIITTVEGSSIQEYSTSLAEKAGLSGDAIFFKGSVDYSANELTESSNEMFIYTYMDVNTKWRVSMDTRNLDKLIEILDEQFRSDIETLSPKELFDNYGTHFISSAYLGGRIDYITTSRLSNSLSKSDVKLAAEASYKTISGNYSSNSNSSLQLNSEFTKTRLNVVGGNSEYANNISSAAQYKKWAEGIVTAPVLCGFDEKSLMPIWLLAKNESRRLQLEKYFNSQIITKYPFPTFFKSDPILDSEDFVAHYSIHIYGFEIIDDCDASTLLTVDESGDFKYAISIYENDNRVANYSSPEGQYYSMTAGENLNINKMVKVEFPLSKESSISVKYFLKDYDEISADDVLGSAKNTHPFPFSKNILYNSTTDDGKLYYSQRLYHSSTCEANFNYVIFPDRDPTAMEFGNKGWQEYEKGNYNECLNYSRKALEINNTLWYAQFNVALVYLIQKNPKAFNKYQTICEYCGDTDTIKAALQDISDYEKKFGELQNSEPVKILLKSKLK